MTDQTGGGGGGGSESKDDDSPSPAAIAQGAVATAQAASEVEHDPVGGLLAMADSGAGLAEAAGADSEAAEDVKEATSTASTVASAVGAATPASPAAASPAAASPAATPASPAPAASRPPAASSSGSSGAAASAPSTTSEQASWGGAGGSDVLHVHYTFLSDADGGSGWRVHRFRLEERLDAPYECVLDLTHDDPTTDPLTLLGHSATVTIERYAPRDVHGIVRRVERGETGASDRTVSARIFLVPALWALSRTRNTRVFQELKVPDILKQVLEAGLGPLQREVQLDLQSTYKPREYCMQWEESDLDFCQRLMEEEGIWYHFDFSGDVEKLVLGDTSTSFPALETQDGNAVPYSRLSQGSGALEAVMNLESSRQLVPNKAVVREYDWTRPPTDFEGEAEITGSAAASKDEPVLEEYFHGPIVHFADFSSPSFGGDDTAKQADLQKRRRATEIERALARTELSTVTAGMTFELTGHPIPELDRKWLVVSVRHQGAGGAEGASAADDAKDEAQRADEEYINYVELMPADADWRPARTRHKRRVNSVLTATVVGPGGEEIHTDVHGRIKVQFHWDREGQKDDHSSCFIRSMQPWAGQGWGFVFLPRIGMEVVVTFVDGDIDRPLVIGSVYNGVNPPPYALPDDKTKSTIKSNSSPGGDGFNELRFEDAAGHEEIFVHAQKDMNEVVLNDHTRSVGNNETISVTANRVKSVDKNETITITGSQKVTISGAEKADGQTITGGQLDITGKYKVDASDEIMVQAPNKITFTCGGSTIVMEPGKITMTSGGKATIVLDADALMEASGHGKVFLNADANVHASGGGDMMLTADAAVRSNAGSHVTLDANALVSASAGAQANLTADATVSGANATLSGQTAATVSAPTATLQGGAGSVEAAAAGVSASGPTINIAGAGSTSISGAVVKIN